MAATSARNVSVIAKREFMARIRSKGFWISTVALPILMAAWLVVPSLVISKTRSSQRLAVVDQTGKIAAPLAERLDEWAKSTAEQVSFDIEQIDLAGDVEALRRELDRRTLEGEIQAWIWIDEEGLDNNTVEYHASVLE